MRRLLRVLLAGLGVALPALAQEPAAAPPLPPVRLLTFNIRYGTAPDGENSWEHRRELVLRVLEHADADVVALQEALSFQLDFLLERLPRYRAVGAYREVGADGRRQGEWTGLLVDRHHMAVEEEGRFWLSEEPSRPGSRGWDAALPRVAVWAVLRERRTGVRFAVLGTHMDHRGARARLEGARLLVARARALQPLPVVVLGDLNATPDSPPLQALFAAGFRDVFRVLDPEAEPGGTFHGFEGGRDGPRIDHVLVDGRWAVHEARILRGTWQGHHPSDHYPVYALVSPDPGRPEGARKGPGPVIR